MCHLCELKKYKRQHYKKRQYHNESYSENKCRQSISDTYCYNKPKVVGHCIFGNSSYIIAGQTTINLCCNNINM
jgi:hypothetical protein